MHKYLLLIILFALLTMKPDIYHKKTFPTLESIPQPKSHEIHLEKMPWENEPKFLNAQKKNNTYVRLGAYMTVLPDPLPGEEYNVSIGAARLAGVVLKPRQVLSQNATIGPYTQSRGYKKGPTYQGGNLITTVGGGVCKIASTLYNVAILSNLGIAERHNHSMIVPYVPLGQDATVYYGSKDIKILNNTKNKVLVWAKSVDNVLYIAFYGTTLPPKVTWNSEILRVKKTYTITKRTSKLHKGDKRVVCEGYNGYVVKRWLTIKYPNEEVKTKNLGVDYYSPMPRVVEIGTKP